MKNVIRGPLLMAFCALLVAGCASQQTQQDRESHASQEISRAMEEARASSARASAPPAAVTDALIPRANGGGADPHTFVEPRFDLNVENQSARAFFMGLVRGTRYNMVVHPDVSGTISLSLRNVSVAEVMDIARDAYGYEFQSTSSGYMVLPAQVRTQVFEVNYLNVTRSGSSTTRVSSGQSTENPSAMMQPGAGGFGGQQQLAGGQEGRGNSLSGSSVETESEADFWATLRSTMESMIGTGENRGVIINPQTGTVVVRAMPAELREVTRYLSMVQNSAQRMVIIEAKVIEVELRDGFETGINWSAIASRAADGTPRVFGGVVRGRDLFSSSQGNGTGSQPVPGGQTPPAGQPFGGVFGVGIDTRDFDGFMELLSTQGRAQVLSSPRTTAVNNQKAVIKVGSDEYFVTGIGSQTTTGTATNTNTQVQLTPFFSGIALDVTPQISADGVVIMHIQPTVSEVTDQTKTFTVAGRTESLPLAFSSVRQSDSIVRARSGQVIVIGGLMRTSLRDDMAGTPGISRVPGIGALFRHNRQREVKSELVILLQPIIVDDSTWGEQLREHDRRVRAMTGAVSY